jgi:hypothetical protein
MSQSHESLLRLLLPEGLLDYFEVTKIHHDAKEIWIYLEELNTIPNEYSNDKLISKGFLPESSIQDFPLRGKAVLLFVKRRRWLNTTDGQLVTRNWDMVAKGTRMTLEFASFLKELSRYRAGKL